MNLSIRKATLADIDAMTGLLYQLFSIEEDFTFNAEKQKRGLALLINSNETAVAIVAELNGIVIGMLTAQTNISTVEGGIAAVLEDMVIDKSLRGKGIGKSLMQAMEQWAKEKGITRLQLLADKTNSPALAYYNKLGWTETKMFCLRKYIFLL
jgi:GNAT superfamily N-acetyltransferase